MPKVCTTCAEAIEASDYFYLSATSFTSTNVPIKHLLKTCIPDYDNDLFDDSLICRNCVSALHIAYSFRNMVLSNKTQVPVDRIAVDSDGKTRNVNRQFRCTECDFKNDSKSALVMHQRVHSGEKPFHCTLCPYRAKRKSHLQDHAKTHWDVRPFKCDFCDKDFCTKTILRKHRRIHTGEQPYACSQCGLRSRYKNVIDNHVRKEHSIEKLSTDGRCVCEICGLSLSGPASLSTHMRVHTGVKSHLCELCGERFREAATLKTHLSSHSGEKPFKCLECGYCAARKARLDDHMKTHVTYISA